MNRRTLVYRYPALWVAWGAVLIVAAAVPGQSPESAPPQDPGAESPQDPPEEPAMPTDSPAPPADEVPVSDAPPEGSSPTTEAPGDAPPEPAPRPRRKPKYLGLRYNEDWSYLEGDRETYEPDAFNALKNIDLGGDLRLDVGGSIRLRFMLESNKAYGLRSITEDSYLLDQYLLHANLRYKDVLRFFIEGIHAQPHDRQTPALGVDENRHDIHQMFLDVKPLGADTPLTLRVGRQEMLFGKQRMVSPLAWANTRRKFDAADLLYRGADWHLDGFYARPVPVNRSEGLERKWDEYDEDQHFFGLYSTYKGWKTHAFDWYYLVLLDSTPRLNSAGFSDNLTLHTFGSRWGGKTGPWDYDLEGTMQLGHHSGDRIFAWSVAMEGGHTFKDWPMAPRVSLGFDWATGDKDPTDDEHNTFNQLYPLGHKYFGFLDLVGRQNIISPHVALAMKPLPPVTVRVAYLHFWLDQNNDALYDAGGNPRRRDPIGNSGSTVGGELDVTLKWQIDTHQAFLFGYSHMWTGSFIKNTGDDDDPDLLYFQYQFTF